MEPAYGDIPAGRQPQKADEPARPARWLDRTDLCVSPGARSGPAASQVPACARLAICTPLIGLAATELEAHARHACAQAHRIALRRRPRAPLVLGRMAPSGGLAPKPYCF